MVTSVGKALKSCAQSQMPRCLIHKETLDTRYSFKTRTTYLHRQNSNSITPLISELKEPSAIFLNIMSIKCYSACVNMAYQAMLIPILTAIPIVGTSRQRKANSWSGGSKPLRYWIINQTMYVPLRFQHEITCIELISMFQ